MGSALHPAAAGCSGPCPGPAGPSASPSLASSRHSAHAPWEPGCGNLSTWLPSGRTCGDPAALPACFWPALPWPSAQLWLPAGYPRGPTASPGHPCPGTSHTHGAHAERSLWRKRHKRPIAGLLESCRYRSTLEQGAQAGEAEWCPDFPRPLRAGLSPTPSLRPLLTARRLQARAQRSVAAAVGRGRGRAGEDRAPSGALGSAPSSESSGAVMSPPRPGASPLSPAFARWGLEAGGAFGFQGRESRGGQHPFLTVPRGSRAAGSAGLAGSPAAWGGGGSRRPGSSPRHGLSRGLLVRPLRAGTRARPRWGL